MPRYELAGKTALVTGGARGIGLATAKALSARGARVVLCDLDDDAAREAAASVHPTALGVGADVTDRGALQRLVAQTVERFGGLDVVVANAGIASRAATMRAMHGEAFDRTLEVNLFGVQRTVEAALPQIVARRGHVVVVSSIYAFTNGMGAMPYAMSKAGVEQLGRALRVELAQHGASASVAYFGFIDTDMVHGAIDQDPTVTAMLKVLPKPLHKRLEPQQAGEGIVRGIEGRKPRIVLPRRWTLMSLGRGVIGPLTDAFMERDATVQAAMREVDDRAGEEQPLTA